MWRQHGARQLSVRRVRARRTRGDRGARRRCAPRARRRLRRSQSARLQLASWTPPEADLGFAIVRPPVEVSGRPGLKPQTVLGPGLRPGAWFRQPLPGVGAGRGGLPDLWRRAVARRAARAPRRARRRRQTVATAATPRRSADGDGERPGGARAAAARRDGRAAGDAGGATAAAPQSASNAQLLAQVRALIDESEQRQQRELALRTAQVVRDFDSQRRVDLAQIQRNFGQIEGLTGAEVREQRQMLNYLMRVSEQR